MIGNCSPATFVLLALLRRWPPPSAQCPRFRRHYCSRLARRSLLVTARNVDGARNHVVRRQLGEGGKRWGHRHRSDQGSADPFRVLSSKHRGSTLGFIEYDSIDRHDKLPPAATSVQCHRKKSMASLQQNMLDHGDDSPLCMLLLRLIGTWIGPASH